MRSWYARLALLRRHWPKLAIAALLLSAAELGLNLWIVRSIFRRTAPFSSPATAAWMRWPTAQNGLL
jgi:hypothetical protein